MIKNLFISLTILIFAFSACNKRLFVEGNRSLSTQTRSLSDFNEVINEGDFDVLIIEDSISYVFVEAESNLLSYIETYTDNNKLIISTDEMLNSHLPIVIEVHTATLKSVKLLGSGSLEFNSFYSDHFEVINKGSGDISGVISSNDAHIRLDGSGKIDLSLTSSDNTEVQIYGSGDVLLRGETANSKMEINGSGKIEAFNFIQSICETETDGSGDIYTRVSDKLDVDINGSGSVYYKGYPSVNYSDHGSGRLINSN